MCTHTYIQNTSEKKKREPPRLVFYRTTNGILNSTAVLVTRRITYTAFRSGIYDDEIDVIAHPRLYVERTLPYYLADIRRVS